MVKIDLRESPLRFLKENKTSRSENDTLRNGECKVINRGPFRKKKLVCKSNEKIIQRYIK